MTTKTKATRAARAARARMATARAARWPLGATTVRVNWTLRHRAKLLAERAGRGSSQASYVSSILEQREDEWLGALEHLEAAGWKRGELRGALELVKPVGFVAQPVRAVQVALDRSVSDLEARALLVLAREWLAGNGELQGRLA